MYLLDLPDALLVQCLAGAGGSGVCQAAAACKRLRQMQQHLHQEVVFSSAMATDKNLEDAISSAALRAMQGTWGAVDFAVLFVANYKHPKKYTDPHDATHCVEMLRDVLSKDIPIVGCCSSGVMGIDVDSLPLEVDPQCTRASARGAGRNTEQPRRGVSVLLGRLPLGWTARAMAPATLPVDLPPQAALHAEWPELSDALALTSSQKSQLAAKIGAPQDASSEQVTLQPELCLLLYRSEYQGSEDLDVTLAWLHARAPEMCVVGGASSGSGDLLFSPGAAHRLAADEAPADPTLVGLLLCSAHCMGSTRPAAAAAPPPKAPCSCSGALRVASLSVQGVGPAPGAKLYVDVGGVAVRSIAYASGPPIVFIVSIDSARQVPAAAGAASGAITAAAAAGAAGEDGTGAAAEEEGEQRQLGAAPVRRSSRVAAAATAAPAASGPLLMMQELGELDELGSDSLMLAVWRVAVGETPLAFTGDEEVALVFTVDPDDTAYDTNSSSLQLTLFELCRPLEGSTEELLEALVGPGAPGSQLCMQFVQYSGEASARAVTKGFTAMRQQLQTSSLSASSLSSQAAAAVVAAAPGPSARAVGGPAVALGGLPGNADACYEALATTAKAVGARSGRQATAVFSCTGRGAALYRSSPSALTARPEDVACEAALLDTFWQQSMPFVGVYVDGELGPPVKHASLGLGAARQRAQQQAYTSMFAALAAS